MAEKVYCALDSLFVRFAEIIASMVPEVERPAAESLVSDLHDRLSQELAARERLRRHPLAKLVKGLNAEQKQILRQLLDEEY